MEQTTLLLLLTLNCFSYGSQYYVKPTPDTECPEPCHTLSHYTSNPDYFKPNRTFLFLPGVFTLEETAVLKIGNARGIALIGSKRYTATDLKSEYPIPVSEIECVGLTGIAFCAGSNIAIKHIRMRNCYMGLVFIFTMNVKVQHILIENSTAIGIYGIQMLGNNSIVDSAFVRNTENAKFEYSEYYYEAEVCPVPRSLSMVASRLEIEGSHFLQGHQNLQYDGVGGLTISMQRFPVDVFVQVADTTFFQNRGSVGGNMAVYVNESVAENVFVIENCSFINGSAYEGGAIAVYVQGQLCNSVNHLQPRTILQISSSYFRLNSAVFHINNRSKGGNQSCGCGGAVIIKLLKNCNPADVHISNCAFLRNIAESEGAGISIYETTYPRVINMISIVNDTVFEGGSAGTVGGGISYTTTVASVPTQILTEHDLTYALKSFQLSRTNFSGNTAGVYAGALFLTFQILSSNSDRILRKIEITDCDISNNVGLGIRGATGVLIHSTHSPSSHKVVLTNVSTCCHRGVHLENKVAVTSVMVVSNIDTIQFINCNFYNNNQTALMALTSQLTFVGNTSFVNNQGSLGGALALHDSVIYLCNNTELVIKNNKALWQGGGIYVAQEIPFSFAYPCFFQISAADYTYLSQFSIHIILENNTAPTGSAIYGGSVDFCTSKSVLLDDQKITYPEGKWIFDAIVDIKPSEANDPSVISSAAQDVCFCESGLVQCSMRVKNATTYPGGILNTSVVSVGQRNGTSPGTIVSSRSHFFSSKTNAVQLSIFHTQCWNLIQKIFTQEKAVTIQYRIGRPSSKSQGIHLLVSLLECPPGFILTPNGLCDCVPVLNQHGINCTIDDQTVHRIAPLWIGYRPPAEPDAHSNLTAQEYSNSSEEDGTIVHKHCPFDYCKVEDVYMWLNDTDEQCANNHSGVLCGACKPGFSVVFGSSRCLICTSAYLALVLAFAVAGVVLVALLTLCGLTVSEGTLNGLVFYANAVQANSSTFFPNRTNQVLTIFIAWVNLDLGIETCFYDGMDMYAKAWLQFVFPIYIWLLVIAITVSSNYSITAAKLAGRNAPKVLSTLFLLSDARILRAIITAFSFTSVSQPSGRNATLVWLPDGNVHYFSGRHIALLIAGLLFTVLFLTPYTLVVCFIQHLQRHSSFRLLRWVQRLKPLLDAYTGPYKDKYRFWTGLLLLVRVVLFLAIALNALGDPSLNLLLINVTANCLLALKWMLGGIYKKWPLDILEASSFLNLSILSAATLYAKLAGGDQVAITSISTGTALVTFVGIVIYHMYKNLTKSVYLRRLKDYLRKFFKTQNTISPELEPLATGTRSSSNDSDSEDLRMEPHARVQPLRLTFDTYNEPVLVAISDNCIRVQKQAVDQDEECALVVSDTTRE